jgi:hypothetical protein
MKYIQIKDQKYFYTEELKDITYKCPKRGVVTEKHIVKVFKPIVSTISKQVFPTNKI